MDGGLFGVYACRWYHFVPETENLPPEYFRLVGNMVKGLQGKNDHNAS